jgi:hypothetical protein
MLIRNYGSQRTVDILKGKKKKNTYQPRILYLAKLTFKNEEIKAFVDKPKADSLLSVDLP